MFERIVVGVSRAESAEKAARYGMELATKFGAELHLVTAFEEAKTNPGGSERRHAEGFLESMALASPLSIRTHALPGDPAAALLQVADEVGADLIVVGNKGMRGAGRILGSVPNSVAHRTGCSVLIVNTT
jgi:nucleotide-binding universal stress UspA family protein